MPAIRVENLTKHYTIALKESGLWGAVKSLVKKNAVKTVEAVRGISFSVERGELVGFLGPNGAGKTTTLKMLSGLLYPTAGSMSVLGFSPSERPSEFLRRFSMVMGQRTQLWWDLPARETYRLNQKIYEIPDEKFVPWLEELSELLDLKGLLDVPVKKLSLGQRMKAELVCALLHQPEVLLLDEPTLGLDLVMQKKLREFILDYNRRFQATILLTSHNMADVEELAERVLVIDDGRILFDGKLSEVTARFAPEKQIAITASSALSKEALTRYGRIIESNSHTATLEIPREKISSSVAQILAELPVVDLSVEELPIEEIIRKLFTRHLS